MAHRRLLAENLAALARGMLLMAFGVLLFAASQDAVSIEGGDVVIALLGAVVLYVAAYVLLPSEEKP